jgi:putative membrane protein
MKTFSHLLMMLIISGWLGAIALFSIQNVKTVSLQFLGFASISLPIGLLLTFSAIGGMILGAVLPLFLSSAKRSNRRPRSPEEDLDAFDFD